MNNQTSRVNMIKQQLRTGDVLNEDILSLFANIPRDDFLPEHLKSFAYSDTHIPLGHDQCMMTPLEEGLILQALGLKGHEVVLEVGTGSGFLTALLSRLSKKVISIDYYEQFTAHAQRRLAEHHCQNIELYTGDASQGWADLAPYDVIIFTGAQEQLSTIERLQLVPGGKLFAILGKEPVMQGLLYTLDHNECWSSNLVFETCLPKLIDHAKHNSFNFQDQTVC